MHEQWMHCCLKLRTEQYVVIAEYNQFHSII